MFKLKQNQVWMAYFFPDLMGVCNGGNFSGKTDKKKIGYMVSGLKKTILMEILDWACKAITYHLSPYLRGLSFCLLSSVNQIGIKMNQKYKLENVTIVTLLQARICQY